MTRIVARKRNYKNDSDEWNVDQISSIKMIPAKLKKAVVVRCGAMQKS